MTHLSDAADPRAVLQSDTIREATPLRSRCINSTGDDYLSTAKFVSRWNLGSWSSSSRFHMTLPLNKFVQQILKVLNKN